MEFSFWLNMGKKIYNDKKYYCSTCKNQFHFRMHRSWFVKNILFFLSVRKFFCAKCQKAVYILVQNNRGQINN